MNATLISDVLAVREVLLQAARDRRSLTYSALLSALGYTFTRPKMRMVCKTIGQVDDAGHAADEPELAVLVVRESDGLPGQGWWASRSMVLGYQGSWSGAEAADFIRAQQEKAFRYWAKKSKYAI